MSASALPSPTARWLAALLLLALLGWGGFAAARRGGPTLPRAADPGNVLLVLCDTLRADHLGLYGYPRPTSPFLDALGRRAWVYEDAYSHFSFTWPSVANLFTGLPYSRLERETLFVMPSGALETGGLAARSLTLAERLGRAGVRAAAVSANPYVTSRLGFAQGFAAFRDIYRWNPRYWEGPLHKLTAEAVNAAALREVERLEAQGSPWFLFLQYFDPHSPYSAPAEDRALFVDPAYSRTGRIVDGNLVDPQGKLLSFVTGDLQGWVSPADRDFLVAQYDAEVHHFDRGMRALFAALQARGALERTTVVITADHGEALLERGFWGHGFLSRAEEEHVPMIVVPARRERARPARVHGVATTTDVHYSVLRRFGAEDRLAGSFPAWGVDLFTGRPGRGVAYTEGTWGTFILRSRRYTYYSQNGSKPGALPMPIPKGEFLFDLASDPAERINLFDADPRRSLALRERLLRGLGTGAPPPNSRPPGRDLLQPVDEESRRRLRALGYS